MMPDYEFGPVDHITIDTVGPPGERTFYLQVSEGPTVFTVIIEKQQAAALAEAIDQVLNELGKQTAAESTKEYTASFDLELRKPVDPQFRVSQMGLGFEEDRNLLAITVQELVLDPAEQIGSPTIARLYATPDQMRALSQHAVDVVEAGRPICSFCGQPIDPEGHFCIRENGHYEGLTPP